MPRLTPTSPQVVASDESAPDQTPSVAAAKPHVGPWLEYRVANSDTIDGKSFLKLRLTPGYDSVLELTSYDAPDHEDFPSLYLRAVLAVRQLSELVGKKLHAELYIQVESEGNLIHNQAGQTVELEITAMDEKYVRGTFQGLVHDVDLGGDGPIHGKFQAFVE